LHLHFGVELAVTLDVAEEVKGGGLIGTYGEASGGIVAEFGDGVVELMLEALEAAGVVEDGAAGIGEDELFARTVDELFAEFEFEALKGEGNGGLSAEKLLGSAGEAFFRGHREKDLEGVEFHSVLVKIQYNIR
jgi:hypothetical protein